MPVTTAVIWSMESGIWDQWRSPRSPKFVFLNPMGWIEGPFRGLRFPAFAHESREGLRASRSQLPASQAGQLLLLLKVMPLSDVVIVGAARTPIGRYGGAFRTVHPAELG